MEKKKPPRKSKTSLKSLKSRIGQNLRRRREANGWTQEDLEGMGLNRRFYQDVEGGKRDVSLSYLWRLARIFGVDVIDLMTEAD